MLKVCEVAVLQIAGIHGPSGSAILQLLSDDHGLGLRCPQLTMTYDRRVT